MAFHRRRRCHLLPTCLHWITLVQSLCSLYSLPHRAQAQAQPRALFITPSSNFLASSNKHSTTTITTRKSSSSFAVRRRSTTNKSPSLNYEWNDRKNNGGLLFDRRSSSSSTTTTSSSLFSTTTPNTNSAVIDSNTVQENNTTTTTKDEMEEEYDYDNNNDNDPFTLLSTLAATTLLQSDRRRDAIGKSKGAQASSATNWIDEGSAFTLRNALDKLKLFLPGEDDNRDDNGGGGTNNKNGRERQDEAITWLRWLRSIPRPIIVDLSLEVRSAANDTVSDDFLKLLNVNTAVAGSSTGDKMNTANATTTTTATSTTTNNNNNKTPGRSKMQQLRTDFLNRLQCRLVLLPSGQGMRGGLLEPSGSLTFGKLLYGGVTRYRILPSSSGSSSSGGGGGNDAASSSSSTKRPPRRAGERTERKTSKFEHVPSWVQYGGTERRYDAVDMGPAMVLEWSLLPKIQGGGGAGAVGNVMDVAKDDSTELQMMQTMAARGDMLLHRIAWSPRNMFRYVENDDNNYSAAAAAAAKSNSKGNELASSSSSVFGDAPMTLQGKDRNDAFASDFRSRVGGLGTQIDSIVRRVLDGRVIRPAEVDDGGNLLSYAEAKELAKTTTTTTAEDDGEEAKEDNDLLRSLDGASKQLSLAALEAEELALLGLTPVRGLLLYGPPGCGKTALAREIARALRARAPKIVSAPELLDRWVGGSERLVRELFHDAEAELASVNGDASRSALHVIVIDEIDATFRKRSSAEDSGEATRSSTVNQILAKLDGVEAIPNVLMIGMTNRRELLDEALLRPGRLEVQIEIPLPDSEGRREILNIHFGALRSRGRLSQPLCSAIDGTGDIAEESDVPAAIGFTDETSTANANRGRKRRALKRATNNIIDYLSTGKKTAFDLADDDVTGGFSGADLEGLVRCAGSIALSRARKEGAGVESLLITLDDVNQALAEVKV